MGHVHLRVSAIPPTVAFCRSVLGLDLMAQLGSQAAFLSWGGYHHHVGANTWESAGAPPPPPGTAALRRVTLSLPDAAARDRVLDRAGRSGAPVGESAAGPIVRDPSGNAFLLLAEGSAP